MTKISKTIVLILVAAVSLPGLGCSVYTPELIDESPEQISCELPEQDNQACKECIAPLEEVQLRMKNASVELEDFDACYESSYTGSDVGDAAKCAEGNPKGAEEWKELVAAICKSCSSDCCYFCSSEWGALVH
jgi:hypothetical protein